jgi:tRNA acetyltransferase TAN1
MNPFNLILSSSRFREESAQDEILELLQKFGDPEAECTITEIKGILLASTSLDSTLVVDKLKELTSEEPWEIRYVLRVLPVMKVVSAEIDDIVRAAVELGGVIKAGDKFKITIEKRHSSLEKKELIEAVASKFENRVDLENPDWIVMIQIVGALVGLSVIRPNQIFSSVIEKRS